MIFWGLGVVWNEISTDIFGIRGVIGARKRARAEGQPKGLCAGSIAGYFVWFWGQVIDYQWHSILHEISSGMLMR